MQGKYLSLAPLLNWRSMPRPLVPEQLYGRTAPLVLEIGFGNGEFLTRTAAEERDKDFLGMELEWKAVRRALRRAKQLELTNLKVILGDAREAVEWGLPPACLSQVTIQFPCPWPKRRHERHRLFSVDFLRLLKNRLKPDGHVWIVTDFEPLFEQIRRNGPLAGYRAETEEVPARLNTKYERRWSGEGQQLFYETRLYPEGPAAPAPELPEVEVRIPTLTEFPAQIELPEPVVAGSIRVNFRELMLDKERRKAMWRVFVVEEPLHQDFWVELAPVEHKWHLRPSAASVYFPTRGVQTALDSIRATLR